MEPQPRPKPQPRMLRHRRHQDDHIDPTTREWVTVDDNGNMVFPEASEAKATELGARFEGWLVSHEFTPEQERWLHDVEQRKSARTRTLRCLHAGSSGHSALPMGGLAARGRTLRRRGQPVSRRRRRFHESVYGANRRLTE